MSPQLEESEFTCAAAVKARKSMEVEIEDLHLQIDDLSKAKAAVSDFGVRRAAVGTCPQGETPSPCQQNEPTPSGVFFGESLLCARVGAPSPGARPGVGGQEAQREVPFFPPAGRAAEQAAAGEE